MEWTTPQPRNFTGETLTLSPLGPARDAATLFQLTHGSEAGRALWRFLPRGPFENAEAMRQHLHEWQSDPGTLQFLATGRQSGAPIGSISLMRITPAHGVAELGYIWWVPEMQRTKANTE